MPDFTEINRIVKHRYDTGEYGSTHFRMTSAFWGAARSVLPKPTPPPVPWGVPALDALLAIPILLDEDLGGDEWRLVDTCTEEVLFRGDGAASPSSEGKAAE